MRHCVTPWANTQAGATQHLKNLLWDPRHTTPTHKASDACPRSQSSRRHPPARAGGCQPAFLYGSNKKMVLAQGGGRRPMPLAQGSRSCQGRHTTAWSLAGPLPRKKGLACPTAALGTCRPPAPAGHPPGAGSQELSISVTHKTGVALPTGRILSSTVRARGMAPGLVLCLWYSGAPRPVLLAPSSHAHLHLRNPPCTPFGTRSSTHPTWECHNHRSKSA